MTAKLKIFWGVATVLLMTLIAMGIIPVLTGVTNCGGNGYALTVCADFVTLAEYTTGQANDVQFEIGKMDKAQLRQIAKYSWGIGGYDLLVRTNFSPGNADKREPVIVCTQQFGNIPRPTIWNFYHRHLAHAIGYSDGKVGLISPAEFKSLNLSGFTSVSNLVTSAELTITN